MPKPGIYGNKPSWKNQYNEHDFRGGGGGGDTRRVSFKTNRHHKRDNKDWSASMQAHLQDENIDMGGSSGLGKGFNRKHHNNKGRKGGRSDSPAPTAHWRKRLLEGPINWYRVMLPYGNKYEKSFVLKTLLEHIDPMPLWPIMWNTNGNRATFYIDDRKVAEKLLDIDGKLQMPDGFRLIIKVNCGYPNVDINSELKEKIKVTMAKRYNAITKALDLTKFHYDPDLQGCFCALFKPTILMAVVDIIAENIPEIEAINLGDNKIPNLAHLKKASGKLPNLKVLHLGNNTLRDISQLDPLIGLPIVELVLNGNPLCTKYKDQESYIGLTDEEFLVLTELPAECFTPKNWTDIANDAFGPILSFRSEVRKRFPKVMKLDGVELPPPITFDLAEEMPLPRASQTFLCNQEGGGIARQFLEQYFLIFDTDNRQPMLQAYHENAVFSLTMAYPYGQKDKNTNWLNWYTPENRNLIRVTDPDRRSKLLKQGQLSVVGFLQEMPPTKHDIHSFTVDLTLFTPQMICLTVSGMFKEFKSGHKNPPLRAFFRTFVIVPAGAGFCITNETVHITNATEEQARTAFKTPVTLVAPPPTPVASPVPVSPPAPIVPDDVTKQQMIQAISEQSGMNISWSQKCLQEVNWDFNLAITTFNNLNKQGVVPAEAFVR